MELPFCRFLIFPVNGCKTVPTADIIAITLRDDGKESEAASMKPLQIKFPLFVAIPLTLVLSLLFSALLFWVQGRLQGGPALLLLGTGALLFSLIAMCCIGFWVYQDCKLRMDDPVLWVLLCALSCFLILPVYLFRRLRRKDFCPDCQSLLVGKNRLCPRCGVCVQAPAHPPKRHHTACALFGIGSFLLSLLCLAGFFLGLFSFTGDLIARGEPNVVMMKQETYFNGVWQLSFLQASYGITFQQDIPLSSGREQALRVDAACGAVPEGGSLTLSLRQGEQSVTLDITDLSQPLLYPLDQFESGVLSLALQSNGAENVSVLVSLQPQP